MGVIRGSDGSNQLVLVEGRGLDIVSFMVVLDGGTVEWLLWNAWLVVVSVCFGRLWFVSAVGWPRVGAVVGSGC